jgi:hypothetical protein
MLAVREISFPDPGSRHAATDSAGEMFSKLVR